MRLLVTGGAGFIGSHYVRTVLQGGYEGYEPDEVVVLDALTYAGNRANLDPVAQDPRLRFVTGDIRDAEVVDPLLAEADHVVHFAAESHVDRSIGGAADFVLTNVVGTQVAARRRAAARGRQVRARVHRRGVRLDRERLVARGPAAGAQLPVLRLQGRQRPARPRLLPDPRAAGLRDPLLQQLRAVPVPREGHPAVRHATCSTAARSRCTATGRTSATGCTSTTTAAASSSCSRAGGSGEVYNIGGGTELTNKELTERLLDGHRPRTGTPWSRSRTARATTAATRWTSARSARSSATSPACRFDEGLADTVEWYRDNRSWWEPLKQRASLGA